MTDSKTRIKLSQQSTEIKKSQIVRVSMIRQTVTVGDKTVLAFMDAKGLYYLHSAQTANLISKKGNAIESFIVQNAVSSLSANGAYKELESLYRNGLSQSADWDLSVFALDNDGRPYRVLPLEVVTQFLRHWDKKGNSESTHLIDALMKESLQIRCESAFVGVSPNITNIIQETNHWLSSRQMNQSVHGAFAQFCKETKIPGCHVHDRMTKLVFGQTARMAINKNQQVGENPDIGLDYQDSPEGQLMIAKMKVKFMSYRKGSWQEKVDRCFEDLT